jgi:hypothetical protein
MHALCWILELCAAVPLSLAWRANRHTSLLATIHWGFLAWLLWGWALAIADRPAEASAHVRFLAVCATGAVAVAVLGARRPGVTAWNFVVAAFLAVALLPLAQSVLGGGRLHLSAYQLLLPGIAVAVGVVNYLPTPLGPAAVLVGLGVGVELVALANSEGVAEAAGRWSAAACCALAAAPWAGFLAIRLQPRHGAEFDRQWFHFRNRLGLVWGQRLREQFNRSAANSGWPVVLYWQGLHIHSGAAVPSVEVQAAMLATLRALMKRFGPAERHPG